jgi:hypothetical protein
MASTDTDNTQDAAQHLENLQIALHEAAPQMFARLVRHGPGDAPYLHITNPAAGRLAEDVTVATSEQSDSQDPYYRWSWEESITPVTTPQIAAAKVIKVLAVCAPQ